MNETQHRSQSGLLRRVTCEFEVGEHPLAAGKQRWIVMADQLSERDPVARARRSYQPLIILIAHV